MVREGSQEGAAKGYNPKRPGRLSHHPLLAFVSDVRMIANYWLRPGNTSASTNYLSFLEDTLSKLEGKRVGLVRMDSGFFARKYPDMKYLAYFQAYTNTYAGIDRLKSLYGEALSVDGIVGIVIGTRPDCIDDSLLDYLSDLSRETFVMVEYGIESANDETLRRINRGHTFECSRQAIEKTHERGILTGGHIILGLPGEDAGESLRQAPIISALPLDVLKIHQMQVIKGTRLAEEYARNPFHVYSVEEYLDLITKYIRLLRRDLVLERFVSQSPPELLIAPKWGLKNYEFTNLLRNRLLASADSGEV